MRTLALFCLMMGTLWAAAPTDTDSGWPRWRGPDMSGMAPKSANPPTTWSATENVAWKVPLPGMGHATPIVWGDHVFIMTAIKTDKPAEKPAETGASWMKPIAAEHVLSFEVHALSRKDGKTVWKRVATEEQPHEGLHGDSTWASNSAVTDGEHLYAYFGSRGLYAYTLSGDLVWSVDLGDMRTRNGFGEGSSPAVWGDYVVVQWDQEDQSFITARDKSTGKEKWKVMRDEPTSWATPIIEEVDGKPQVITSATNAMRGYDLATGEEIWSLSGMTLNAIPSPIEHEGTIYFSSGFRGNSLMAVNPSGAKGDLAGTDHVLWTHDRDTPYVPSPVIDGDNIYFLKRNNGILSCFDLETGEARYGPVRLDGIDGVYASPVTAAGRIYITGRDGTTLVITAGDEMKVLATNTIDERVDASLAIAGNEIYLRTHQHLYAIE